MENEWISTLNNNMDKSQEQNVEWKEQLSQEYRAYDFIYGKLKSLQNTV